MRLMALFVAIALVFGTVVYMVAMVPAVTGIVEAFAAVEGAPDEVAENHDRIETIALRIAPALFILTAIGFALLSATRRQRRLGGGGGGGRI